MRNTKNVINLVVMTGLGLSFSLLTACGGGGGGDADPVVTTLPNCTSNSIYNSNGTWTYSATDSRECRAITTVADNVTCTSSQVRVRIPISSSTSTSTPVVNSNYNNSYSNQQSCIYHNGQRICGTSANSSYNTNWNNSSHYGTNNYSVNNNTNYHTNSSSYKNVCMDQNSQDWHYVVNAGSYYYLNYSSYYNDYQSYQYQYRYTYNKQLSPKETLITFGVLATALFFLSK